MIEEKILLSTGEKRLLQTIIGTKMRRICSAYPCNFATDFVWECFLDFDDNYLRLATKDIVAKLFDATEDGSRASVSEAQHSLEHDRCIKNINRVVRDVLLVNYTFEFESDSYKITYLKAIIFQFDDCNLIAEKLWLFSLAGLVVHLEPLDTDELGLFDELRFWFDPTLDAPSSRPRVTQTLESLKSVMDCT